MAALPISAALPLSLEAWPAVVGAGLIPIVGLLAVGYIIIRAARDNDEEGEEGEEEEPDLPPT